MQYKQYDLNEFNQVCECLHCKNENFNQDDIFCTICGKPITNYCSNNFCKRDLPANARYCSQCGSESIFNQYSLLQSWEAEQKSLLNEKNELSKSPTISSSKKSVDNDELPF